MRDRLLGREPKDYDVATDAVPDRVIELFRSTRKVGAQFGVVLVRIAGHWIEVATFRSDLVYENGRHPTGVVFGSPEQDALRRDFTVNGLFYDPIEDLVVDFVNGQADLEARIIRAIGDPRERFREDHLRIIRAVRFAARLAFEIEPRTRDALCDQAPALRRVSSERIREELSAMLRDSGRARAFDLMARLGILPQLWADADWEEAAIARCGKMLAGLGAAVSFELALAVLLHGADSDTCQRVCRDLACSNATRRAVCWLVARSRELTEGKAPDLGELKTLMARRSFGDLTELYRVRLACEQRDPSEHGELLRRARDIPPEAVRPDPFVNGEDLIRMGLQPGPAYKRILNRLYKAQLREETRSRSEALIMLREQADADV